MSLAEVCRRAGIHKITLQGKIHKQTTKLVVQEWIKGIGDLQVKGVRNVRKRVTQAVDEWQEKYLELARRYNEVYAVHVVSKQAELDVANVKLKELEAEVLRLHGERYKGSVVLIPLRKKD